MNHSPLLPDPALPAHDGGGAAPYAGLALSARDMECVEQTDALKADPEIAGYLREGGRAPWTRRNFSAALAYFAATAGLLLLVFWLFPGNMFSRYRPPAPQDTPRPRPYSAVAEVPILFRESVRAINADIESDIRRQAAFEKLRAFIAADSGDVEAPAEVRIWAREEMLVMLASRELPPGLFGPEYAAEVYADLTRILAEHPRAPRPFRAGAAYVRIRAGGTLPKEKAERRAALEETAALIESLRADHPGAIDRNRDVLLAEAETHIALLPEEYEAGDRYLDYHWRRAAHAILRLYEVFGKNDPAVRRADRRRWQAAYRYFDYTLLTLDANRLGRIASARLDGIDYTRAEIGAKVNELE